MALHCVCHGLNEYTVLLTQMPCQCAKSMLLTSLRLQLPIGTAGSSSNTAYDGLWKAHIKGTLPAGGAGEPPARPPVPPGGYGASMSPADVDGIAKFLEEFTVRLLLPYLEVRVRHLNHQVCFHCSCLHMCLGVLKSKSAWSSCTTL